MALGVLLLITSEFEIHKGVGYKTWSFLTLSGLATGTSWFCYFRALKLGNASQVVLVGKLSVVLVAVSAAVFLGER